MKPYFTRTVILSFLLLATFHLFSQTAENFNSRTGVPAAQVKNALQNSCWQLSGLVTESSQTPIEGDGSLFQDASTPALNAGIYTPVLNLKDSAEVSFTYRFSTEAVYSRWIRICVTTATNQVVKVADSLEIKAAIANRVYSYNRKLATGTGVYRIMIQYIDGVRTAPVAFDQLSIGAAMHYSSGCNQAPICLPDAFSANSTSGFASGNVLVNDRDPDGDAISAYLISGSPDGTVNLMSNGAFTFTPKSGFSGSSTRFTYKVCDNGYGQLCSSEATVTILFSPGNILPVRYVDINAAYSNAQVQLNWTTAYENSTENFDIERGTDSVVFRKISGIKGYGTLGSINFYKWSDDQAPAINQLKELYYRIRSQDVNGKVVYSPVVKVKIEGLTALHSMKVTPNPVTSNIAVNLVLNRSCPITVNVFGATGTVVYQQVVQAAAGNNRILLAGTAALQKGMYFVQVVIDKEEKLITKIIKH